MLSSQLCDIRRWRPYEQRGCSGRTYTRLEPDDENHQVRFLGEGAAAMPLPYPTPKRSKYFYHRRLSLSTETLIQRKVSLKVRFDSNTR
jgi:hypothetical protein